MIPNAQVPLRFDGQTYEAERDQARLSGQMLRVYELMKDGKFRMLRDIVKGIGGHASEASVSARLRDLRKATFGAHKVVRGYVGSGLFAYRLIVRQK